MAENEHPDNASEPETVYTSPVARKIVKKAFRKGQEEEAARWVSADKSEDRSPDIDSGFDIQKFIELLNK